jgi:hypothetical protein
MVPNTQIKLMYMLINIILYLWSYKIKLITIFYVKILCKTIHTVSSHDLWSPIY